MSVIREFLKRTTKMDCGIMQKVRPRIVCKDGFSMSVQAGRGLYCTPRTNLPDGKYQTCEIGYPSDKEPLILEYSEINDYTNTVYGYVPIDVIDQVIEKHGGIVNE